MSSAMGLFLLSVLAFIWVLITRKRTSVQEKLYLVLISNDELKSFVNLREKVKSLLREKNKKEAFRYVSQETGFGTLYTLKYIDFVEKELENDD
ncbi:acyl-CoA synthetase [Paenibacillus popilliae]|uniref:Acyl-coenzyme A synthetases/AMP-(Fatty) acid ligase n=1 Tax=Paenibacillus popilliae ATCC 14706 TaxID=1212764 RepID=M9M419_PAEPP|nr:acyl-CoA synthetase [Paenibacillus popilliae]GAC43819.1 acyl-coenzyme A synthetases/AMP-(fatty) acid ligase [Paenibacillus popilliae ATCC 14706]